jgi:HEAT repeat protein
MTRSLLIVAVGILSMGAAVARADDSDTSKFLKDLASTDAAVRLEAIDQLGERGEATPEVLAALSAQLKDASATVRAHAAHAMGHLGPGARPAIEALAPLVVDADKNVQRMAIRAWARIRPGPEVSVPLFSKLMADVDPATRAGALNALAEVGKPAVPALVQSLKDEKATYWVCLILGEIGPDAAEAVPALVEVLKADQRPEVRREAVLALAAIGPAAAGAVPPLVEALADKDTAIGASAAYALGCVGPQAKEALPALAKSLENADPFLKTASGWALAKIEPTEAHRATAVALLLSALKSDQPRLRRAAVLGLASLKPPAELVLPQLTEVVKVVGKDAAGDTLEVLVVIGEPAVPVLAEALKREEIRFLVVRDLARLGPKAQPATASLAELVNSDPLSAVRREALMALGAIGRGAAAAVPAAIEALDSKQETVAYAACYALGKIGKPAAAAVPVLLKKLGDSNELLAVAAAWALAGIQPDSAETARATVPVLVKGLTESEPKVRVEAAVALGHFGHLAQEAVPALTKLLDDKDESVQTAASEAIKRISGEKHRRRSMLRRR